MAADDPHGTVPIHELERVWYRKGARSWRGPLRRGALGLLLACPLLTAGIAFMVALLIDISPMYRVALVLAAALLGFTVVPLMDLVLEFFDRSYAKGSHTYEIWGIWRGAPVLLLRTDDALQFGQTYRAIARTIEKG